VTGCEC
jgi:hypothetical protein